MIEKLFLAKLEFDEMNHTICVHKFFARPVFILTALAIIRVYALVVFFFREICATYRFIQQRKLVLTKKTELTLTWLFQALR